MKECLSLKLSVLQIRLQQTWIFYFIELMKIQEFKKSILWLLQKMKHYDLFNAFKLFMVFYLLLVYTGSKTSQFVTNHAFLGPLMHFVSHVAVVPEQKSSSPIHGIEIRALSSCNNKNSDVPKNRKPFEKRMIEIPTCKLYIL